MYREYYTQRDNRDAALAGIGLKPQSLRSKSAVESGITKKWDDYVNGLADKYGEMWTAFRPGMQSPVFGKNLAAMVHLTNDPEFMSTGLGKSPVWQTVKDYLEKRSMALEAIASGSDKDNVLKKWGEYVSSIQYSSMKFSDLYDQYLSDDDLSVEVGK
jgi:hypothetical protein